MHRAANPTAHSEEAPKGGTLAAGPVGAGPETGEHAPERLVGPSGFRRARQHILTALLLAAAVGIVVWYVARPADEASSYDVTLTASASGPAPKVGREAPDFQLPGLDASVLRLSDFRGQGVWITFWATWCPPCRAENPDIEATYQKYKDNGLAIIAINLGEGATTAREYMERTKLTFPVALDLTTAVAARYRLAGIPTHYFVDADGILREWRIGGLSRGQMEEKVQSILPAASVTP